MAEATIHLSYLRLRKLIGICGLALPISAIMVTGDVLPSISHYFYSTANILFVGILSILGVFLISYKGYHQEEELISDNLATTIGVLPYCWWSLFLQNMYGLIFRLAGIIVLIVPHFTAQLKVLFMA